MQLLEALIAEPKTPADYKQTSFEFDAKNVHPIDQLEMHKKIYEMISSTLTSTSMIFLKIQVALSNSQSQLKMENISSQSNDNRIKSLEDLALRIGYDPLDVKVVEEIIKKREMDIEALKKHLKILATHDPLTKEIEETESQKVETMKLIMEQPVQIKQMEEEMEKMVQEKKKATKSPSTTMEALPLATIPTATPATVTTRTGRSIE